MRALLSGGARNGKRGNVKYDWEKAMREHPHDASVVLNLYFRYSYDPRAYAAGSSQEKILKAARVQTVAEADRAYVDDRLKGGCESAVLLRDCINAREFEKESDQ